MSEFDTNLDGQTVSTIEETDEKCPRCGGVMAFDPAAKGLKCPYCDYIQAIEAEEKQCEKAEELDISRAEDLENCNWGAEKKTVLCKACGAESVYDALEIASVCPFCGSNQVMEASDQKTMAPGGVVPFQVTDEKASELFKKWIRKKWYCPKLAKESAKAKHFKGVYLPYWTFDAKADSEYRARYGKNRIVRRRDKTRVVTDWYSTSGRWRRSFDDELICASTNHNQSMLAGLEPYRTEENKSYQPEYVAGFAAERYAVGIKEAWDMAKQSMEQKLSDEIKSNIKKTKDADLVIDLQLSTLYRNVTYKYLLLPVWISSYQYKDKVYQFMVNGQTGRISGKAPISAVKIILIAIAVIAAMLLLMNGRSLIL